MKWIFVYYVFMNRELNVSDNDSKGGKVHDAFEMDSSINDFRDTMLRIFILLFFENYSQNEIYSLANVSFY